MNHPPSKFIALLRGINVSGRNKVGMTQLRSACGKIGCSDVQTYIQSGNLLVSANTSPAALEADLEKLIEKRFGIVIPVIVRAAAAWPRYVARNPFRKASEKEPNLVMLALSKAPPKTDAVKTLRERAANGERIEQVGDGLWILFSRGVARSKLSPGMLDQAVGSPVTTRNWRTVLRLNELARARSEPGRVISDK